MSVCFLHCAFPGVVFIAVIEVSGSYADQDLRGVHYCFTVVCDL